MTHLVIKRTFTLGSSSGLLVATLSLAFSTVTFWMSLQSLPHPNITLFTFSWITPVHKIRTKPSSATLQCFWSCNYSKTLKSHTFLLGTHTQISMPLLTLGGLGISISPLQAQLQNLNTGGQAKRVTHS